MDFNFLKLKNWFNFIFKILTLKHKIFSKILLHLSKYIFTFKNSFLSFCLCAFALLCNPILYDPKILFNLYFLNFRRFYILEKIQLIHTNYLYKFIKFQLKNLNVFLQNITVSQWTSSNFSFIYIYQKIQYFISHFTYTIDFYIQKISYHI